jgi:hypothetical protein
MKILKAIDNIGTLVGLKRVSSAYVIDYRNLTEEELRDALKKTSPQYYFEENIRNTLNNLLYRAERNIRILVPLFLEQVLLDRDDYMCPERETDSTILKYQQGIIDQANEDLLIKAISRKHNIEIFNYLLECAWEYNDSISPEEKNLIEKVRVRLKITNKEYRIIEAKLGKYPKPSNQTHTLQEIEDVRRILHSRGLIFPIRDNDNTSYDVLPDEIAIVIRKFLGIEIKNYGYKKLLEVKYVRSKKHLEETLKKSSIDTEDCSTLSDFQEKCIEQVRPSVILGGLTPRDGLAMEDLKRWCSDLKLPISGTKEEVISRIVTFYDNLHARSEEVVDERKIWYDYFSEFACRDSAALRSQQLIEKDIDIERRFEQATNYLFQKKLFHKPLTQVGTCHADGVLSFQDQIILWDNKSKESPVNLKDHIKQFDGYIKSSEKKVACFLVIGPSFTDESRILAMQYKVEHQVTITLITANELKDIGEKWAAANAAKDSGPFPLGYLVQVGRFDPVMVPIG